MLLCVSQQDDSSAEHDDEEASERVSLLLYAHFVSFIVQLWMNVKQQRPLKI